MTDERINLLTRIFFRMKSEPGRDLQGKLEKSAQMFPCPRKADFFSIIWLTLSQLKLIEIESQHIGINARVGCSRRSMSGWCSLGKVAMTRLQLALRGRFA